MKNQVCTNATPISRNYLVHKAVTVINSVEIVTHQINIIRIQKALHLCQYLEGRYILVDTHTHTNTDKAKVRYG